MTRIFLVSVETLILCLTQCTHGPSKRTALEPRQFIQGQHTRWQILKTFSGRARLRYRGRDDTISGRARIVADLPHRFRMELRDPLGRAQLIAVMSQDNFTGFYPTKNLAYVDPTGGERFLRRLFGTRLTFRQFQWLTIGVLPTEWILDETYWHWQNGIFTGKVHQQDIFPQIDGYNGNLKAIRVEPLEGISYSDFEVCCGTKLLFAHELEYRNRSVGTEISIQWEELSVATSDLDPNAFGIVLPDTVKKIVLEH